MPFGFVIVDAARRGSSPPKSSSHGEPAAVDVRPTPLERNVQLGALSGRKKDMAVDELAATLRQLNDTLNRRRARRSLKPNSQPQQPRLKLKRRRVLTPHQLMTRHPPTLTPLAPASRSRSVSTRGNPPRLKIMYNQGVYIFKKPLHVCQNRVSNEPPPRHWWVRAFRSRKSGLG